MSRVPLRHRDQRERAPGAGAAPPAAGPPASTRWQRAARYAPAAAAAAAMVVLGLWGLERSSSMGNDEVVTRWAALLPLHLLFHLLSHVDAVHGLYYLLMHAWMAAGTSPAVMRVPSVIAMTAAVALTAVLARRLTGSGWAALFAGLIMALTPVISYYAQTARSYALVLACVLAATLALLRALDAEAGGAPRRVVLRRWLGYGALTALAGYLNEMALLVLAAHAITVALARPGRTAIRHWAAAGAAGAVAVTPLLVISAREAGAIGWIPPPSLWDLKVLFHDYFGPVTAAGVLLACCAAVAVLPPRWAGEAGPPWWRSRGASLPSVAAPLLVVPAGLLLLESTVLRPLYVDRYVLYGEAGAALLAGAGACRLGRWLAAAAQRRTAGGNAGQPGPAGGGASEPAGARRAVAATGARSVVVWLPGIAVCLAVLLLQLGPQQRVRTPQSRLYDFGGPSRYLAAHAQRGDGVLFFTDFFRKAELGYPADFRNVTDFALAVPPARAGTFQGQDKPLAAVRALMLGRTRIWVVGKGPGGRLPPGVARAERATLESHFTLVSKRHFRHVWVTLWVRRAGAPG